MTYLSPYYQLRKYYYAVLLSQKSLLRSLALKIPNTIHLYENDSSKFNSDILKVEIYFDNFNLATITESPAYSVRIYSIRLGYCGVTSN